jgi:putative transposase
MDIIRRRRLPHWEVSGATYFVTACLHGSIPAQGLLEIARYRADLESRPRPPGVAAREHAVRLSKLVFARSESWLDLRPAVRHLEDPHLAAIVQGAIFYFVGQRYQLLAHVIMPSHMHLVFTPLQSWVDSLAPDITERTPRERIMHGLKRHTGIECNKHLGQAGAFWQHDSYDHWVRDVDELERIIDYVEDNPVKANLVEAAEQWTFSSAHVRRQLGIEWGEPISSPS